MKHGNDGGLIQSNFDDVDDDDLVTNGDQSTQTLTINIRKKSISKKQNIVYQQQQRQQQQSFAYSHSYER